MTHRSSPVTEHDLVCVPREPTEAMWAGLARAIVMWTRFDRPSEKSLLNHLKSTGETIPDWLALECRDVDHVPPKGSVAVWIYRAMLDAAPPVAPAQSTRQAFIRELRGAPSMDDNPHICTKYEAIKAFDRAALTSTNGGGA